MSKEIIQHFLRSDSVYKSNLPEDLTDNYPLVDSGLLDSIGIFKLVVFLEEKFEIKIESQDIIEKNFRTIIAIDSFVKAKKAVLSDKKT